MSNQRGNSLVVGIIICVLVAGGLVGAYYFGMQKNKSTQNVPNQTTQTNETPNNELKFNGIITEVSDKRPMDGALEIKVADKWVRIDIAGDPPPDSPKPVKGEVPEVPVLSTEQFVGKKVEVYAKVLDASNLTIYGSPNYYVKITN